MTARTPLGEFLRARRARLRPSDVGLPESANRRRTPGLRREELAALAGVSIDYYIRLERGQERNPGPAVVTALAEALQLNFDERAHVHALARHASGRQPPIDEPDRRISASILTLLERLRPCPALVLARNADVVAANVEGLRIYPGLEDWSSGHRNTVRWVFCHPLARDVLGDWDDAAQSSAANLRSRLADDPDAADIRALVEELTASSTSFASIWDRYDVQRRRSTTKHIHLPRVGDVVLNHDNLQLEDHSLRLSFYQPADEKSTQVLTLLALDADLDAP